MMEDFLDWLNDDAPEWAVVTAGLVVWGILFALMFVTVFALVNGFWIIPVLIWIVAPSYLIVRAYAARDKEDDQ